MSETKHTPFLWRMSGLHIVDRGGLIALSLVPTKHRDSNLAYHYVYGAVNARPKVEELVKASRGVAQLWPHLAHYLRGEQAQIEARRSVRRFEHAILQVETALGHSSPADTNSPEVRRARGAM